MSFEWAGKCLCFCSGLHDAKNWSPHNLVTLNTLKVFCFLFDLGDTAIRGTCSECTHLWKCLFSLRGCLFSSRSLESILLISVFTLCREGHISKWYLATKILHRIICCFTLNTVSCPISCRAGTGCSGGLCNLLSQIIHVWQTSQWVVSYIFVTPDFFRFWR